MESIRKYMLERKILSKLVEWTGREHKCLVLKGQRQVGKTYILDHFGKTYYSDYILLNLYEDPIARRIFEENSTVDEIVDSISLHTNRTIEPRNTLIVLDEIQESTRARAMLKAFSNDKRYDVIASGSLLGVSDARLGKFKKTANPDLLPVGGEEHLTMYPLDFEEFLWAVGMKKSDIDRIRNSIRDRDPLKEVDMEIMDRRYRTYSIVGGMPKAVEMFVESGMAAAQRELKGILDTCINDINRYNSGVDVIKTQQCFGSIPRQLSSTNKRFQYSRIEDGGSRNASVKFRDNLLWIRYAGYGGFVSSLTAIRSPLHRFVEPEVYKVYMSDSGLLMEMMGPDSRTAMMMGDTSYDFGAVTENVVASNLMKLGYPLYYYRNSNGDNRMELDLILENGGLVAIEVKTGAKREHPSLKKTLNDRNIYRRIIFEKGNIAVDENGIEHYPLFASAFLFDEFDDSIDGSLTEGIVGDPYAR